MLTHGASHQGAAAVPPIRVGAGGHRPRRTFQLPLIRSSDHARGTLNRMSSIVIPLHPTPLPASGELSTHTQIYFPTNSSARSRGPPSASLARSTGLVRLPVLVRSSFIHVSLSIGIGISGSIAEYFFTSSKI